MYDADLELMLAQILFHNQDLLDTGIIEPDDFFTDIRDTVRRMITLRSNGNLLNETTIGRGLAEPSPDERNQFEELVGALKSLNKDRKLQGLPSKLSKIVVDSIPYDDKLIKINQLISTFEDSVAKIEDYRLSESIESYKDKLFNRTMEDIIATDIRMIDVKCGRGFRPGELVTIAGEPGGFKSTLCYNMMLNVALRGEPVMLFTYEISREEVIEILVSMLASIDSIELRTRCYVHADLKRIQQAFNTIAQLPIYVIDSNAKISDIKLMAYQRKPRLILIDYLQIMPDIGADPIRSVEYISRQLKLMSNPSMLNCPIIALSQFSRPSTDKDGNEVERKMSDLKFSSSIEQNSAIVMFAKKVFKETKSAGQDLLAINIVKNRHGVLGDLLIPIIPKFHRLDCNYLDDSIKNGRKT